MLDGLARRISHWYLLPLTAVLALLLATAVHAGDPADFWELDGDAFDEPGPPADWLGVSAIEFLDGSGGVSEMIMEPGNSLTGSPYPYPTRSGTPSDKADLVGAWIHSVRDGNEILLYLAAQRAPKKQGQSFVDPGGNTSVIFALHRFPDVRTAGDLLVIMDFTNGGSLAVPELLEWDGVGYVSINGDGNIARQIANAEGAIGPFGDAIPANIFVEAGVHLTNSSILDPGTCLNVTQLWVMTQSSQSNQASLQDVLNGGGVDLSGAGVDLTNCGSVTVTKDVQGDVPDSLWAITVSPNVSNFTSATLGNGQSTAAIRLNPDQPVTISESSLDGLDFTATWSCSDGTSGAGASFQVTVVEFQDLHCTFTNVTDTPPTVSVTKSANPNSVDEPGGSVTFTVSVTNESPLEAVTITSIDDDQYGDVTDNANPAITSTTCVSGVAIPAGDTHECTFTATISGNAGASHVNVVTVTVQDDDGNEATDTGTATVTVADVLPTISVTKTASVASVDEPGGTVTFTVSVTNTGVAEGVVITSLSDSVYGNLDGMGDCAIGAQVAPGGTYTCTFPGQVSGVGGTQHTNVVTAGAVDDEGNSTSASDSATVQIGDLPSAITVTKTASTPSVNKPGADVTFTVTVGNTSAADTLTLSAMDDSVFGNLSGQGSCALPQSITAGGSYSCAFTAFISAPHTNVVTVTATDDQGQPLQASDDESVDYVDFDATLQVTKTPSASQVTAPGGNVNFTVVVTNTSVVDTVHIDALVDDVYGDLDGQGTCDVSPAQELAPGEQFSCVFTGAVSGAAGTTHVNTVTASGFASDETPVSAFATASVSIVAPPAPPPPVGPEPPGPEPEPSPTPVTAPAPTPTPEVLGFNAALSKVLTSADPARVGELVTFRVVLTVTGDTDVAEARIVDTFETGYLSYAGSVPTGCELLSGSPGASHAVVSCNIQAASPGTPGSPGERIFAVDLTFRAIASTIPGRTTNSAVAILDVDGSGPGAAGEIGPATADVEIVEILGLQLPPTGDGSMGSAAGWTWPLMLMALSVGIPMVMVAVRRIH